MNSQSSTVLDPLALLRRSFRRRRRGKIAHLPEPVREQINRLLDDGLAYAEIISRLGEAGEGLNKDNLSRWRQHDHQDWLEEQCLKELLKKHPRLAEDHPIKNIVSLQSEFGAQNLRGLIQGHPGRYVSLLGLLTKFTTAGRHDKQALPSVETQDSAQPNPEFPIPEPRTPQPEP